MLTDLRSDSLRNGLVVARVNAFATGPVSTVREEVPTPVRWSFLIFVFSIPFEHLGVVQLASVGFFAIYFFYYNPIVANSVSHKRSLPSIEGPIWWFAGYVAVYGFHCLVFDPEATRRFVTFVLLLVLLWVVSGLLRNRKMARDAFIAYSLSASLVATGMLLKVPVIHSEFIGNTGVRTSAFGQDPNIIAMIFVFAILWLIGLYMTGVFRRLFSQASLLCLIAPLLAGIIATSSRTAVVALIAGFVAHLLAGVNNKRKSIVVALAVFCTPLLVYVAFSDPVFKARIDEAVYEGKMAGRQSISTEALDMILEKPLFGWGPGDFPSELGFRTGRIFQVRDAHNMYLHLLLEVGLAGTLPFLIGLWLCGVRAWKGRIGDFGSMPLAVLTALCVSSLGLTLISQKPTWFVIVCAITASTHLMKKTTSSLWYQTPISSCFQ